MKAKLVLVGVALLMAVSLVAAGCGGAAPDSSTTTGQSSSTTTTVLSTTTTGPTSTLPGSTTSLPAPSTSVTSTTIPPTTTTTQASTSTTRPVSTTSTTAALDSGITGLVTLGPISPVEQPGVSNDKPYAATLVIKRTAGSVVAQVRSGEDGRFTIKLAPGTYILEPQNGQPLPRAEAQQVTVSAHAFTEVTVAYDSGIR
jgi:hypothetical protein